MHIRHSICLWMLLVLSADGRAASTVSQTDGRWTVENARVRVTVQPQTGAVSVLDKGCGYTWRQPPVGRAAAKRVVPIRRWTPPANAEWVLSKEARKPQFVITHTMTADARKVDRASDCSARVWCSWDAKHLYVSVAVADDVRRFGEPGLEQWWTRDSTELWVGGKQIGVHLAANALQFRTAKGRLQGGSIVLAPGPGGYVVQATMPWAMLGRGAPKRGQRFPFAVGVNDADAGDREGQVYFPATWKHSAPETFAQAVLADERGAAPAAVPDAAAAYRNVQPLSKPAGIRVETTVQSRGQKLPVILSFTVPDDAPELVVDVDMADRDRGVPHFTALPPLVLDTPNAALAIADYCNGHLYPLDMKPFPRSFMNGNRIDMPWLAIVDGPQGLGYVLILDTSDDCGVRMRKCTMPGRTALAPVVEWWTSQRHFRYARRMKYSFLARGGYVAAAKRYRAHAKQQGLIVPFAEKVKKNPNIARLFGAPDVWGNASLAFAKQAKAAGVDKMLIHGKSAPEDMKAINDLGYLTSTYDNYTDILPLDEKHPDIDRSRAPLPDHAVLKSDGKRQTAWLTFDKKTQFMKRCPSLWVPAASIVIPRELSKYPYIGRFIDVTTAESLYECFDPKHPLTRTAKRECGVALESYVRSQGLVVGGEHGLWWGVPHMDYIEGMMSGGSYSWPAGHLKHPKTKAEEFTSPWGHKLPPFERYEKFGIGHEYRVPLWELVFHDCIVSTWYWGDASDWLLDAAPEITPKKDAFNVLYGTIPLLWANAGGSWIKDREVFLRTYGNTCKLHEQIAGEEMLNHEFVTPDRAVQRTRFSSGTECVVNFGVEPREVTVKGETFTLPQNGFVVRGPRVKQSLVLVNGKPVNTAQTRGYRYSDAGGVGVTMRALGEGRVSIVTDQSVETLAVRPQNVVDDWDFSSTRAYVLDEEGDRVTCVPSRVSGDVLELTSLANQMRFEALCGSAARVPDLAVDPVDLALSSTDVSQGGKLTIDAEVWNLGYAPAKGRITVYVDQVASGLKLVSQAIEFGPGEVRVVRMAVPTNRLDGLRHLVVAAALEPEGQELCRRNNSASEVVRVRPDLSQWPTRVPLIVDAGPVERVEEPVVMPIDFRPIMQRLGLEGPLDTDSLRVAELDALGQVTGVLRTQFDPAPGFDPIGNPRGELCWVMPGRTPSNSQRRFAMLLRTGPSALLPQEGRMWRPETATVDAAGYVARFTRGVLTSLAPKVKGRAGPDFLKNIVLSSEATGWNEEMDSKVERFEATHVGPVRCIVLVRKALKAGVVYEKTYAFYPNRFDVAIDVNKPAGGLYSRAHYRLPATYVDDKGVRAEVDGRGPENSETYGKNKKPRWYALFGKGWAHSCIALTRFGHVAYWDGGAIGSIGFVSDQHKNVRMSYVVHLEQPDASFAEADWRRLTQPVRVRVED